MDCTTPIYDRFKCYLIEQFRDSHVLNQLLGAYSNQFDDVLGVLCSIPDQSSTGSGCDGLTGDRLDWCAQKAGLDRCQCNAKYDSVSGSGCCGDNSVTYSDPSSECLVPIFMKAGYTVQMDSGHLPSTSAYCMDDEEYAVMSRAKMRADSGFGRVIDIVEACSIVFDSEVLILNDSNYSVTVAIQRPYTDHEKSLFPLIRRMICKYPHIEVLFADVPDVVSGVAWWNSPTAGFCSGSFSKTCGI